MRGGKIIIKRFLFLSIILLVILFGFVACGVDDGQIIGGNHGTVSILNTAISNISIKDSIDIRYLLGEGDNFVTYDEIRGIFGNESIYFNAFQNPLTPNRFVSGGINSGVTVYFDEIVRGISVNYEVTENLTDIHFGTINGATTYGQIVSIFGKPLVATSSLMWSQNLERSQNVIHYLYKSQKENRFVRFTFNEEYYVIRINFFMSLPNFKEHKYYESLIAEQEKSINLMYLGRRRGYIYDYDLLPIRIYEILDLFDEQAILVTIGGPEFVYIIPSFGIRIYPRRISGEPGFMQSIIVNYREAHSLTNIHFNGIDGTSTHDDVIAMLGTPKEPRHILTLPSAHWHSGAIKSYSYSIPYEFGFYLSIVSFQFDGAGNVVLISVLFS